MQFEQALRGRRIAGAMGYGLMTAALLGLLMAAMTIHDAMAYVAGNIQIQLRNAGSGLETAVIRFVSVSRKVASTRLIHVRSHRDLRARLLWARTKCIEILTQEEKATSREDAPGNAGLRAEAVPV